MIEIIEVNKCDEDANLIMNWRNDAMTVINSFKMKKYNETEFKNLFYEKYFSNLVPPLFATYNNKKIGFIGFMNNECKFTLEISINIDPKFRGKKLSYEIIEKALIYIKNNYPSIIKIRARIKYFNHASIKLFSKSNFEFKEKILINETIIHCYEYNFLKSINDNIFKINDRKIGKDYSTYIIAELSCNHNQDINLAFKLIDAAADSGADAVKLQTYTPDTMTLDSNKPIFKECLNGTLWEGKTLYELYSNAYTPWEWHKDLKEYANLRGLDLFSSPFDVSAVDFLEKLNIPAYKIASFEITDHILIERIAKTKKPVIISSGMASYEELEEAINILKNNGCPHIAMLKCTSAYPAKYEDANLKTINDMIDNFNVVGGLSDHTLGIEVPIASVLLGARIIEKHFKIKDNSGSEDDAFSLKPSEFKNMVNSIRIVEKSIGEVKYSGVNSESKSKKFRRSLFVTKDMKKGEVFTKDNIKSIRPSNGLHTKHYKEILGSKALNDIELGTPLSWDLINLDNLS